MFNIKNDAPLLDALSKYCLKKPVRLHVPGHGGGKFLDSALRRCNLSSWDVTEINGMDDLHNPNGVIAAAQEKAARLYGAKHTFFLVNGTTVGIQALITATCSEDKSLVLPRNVHRSVLGGLVLSGARPIFLQPEVVPDFGFADGVDPDKLADVLQRNKDIGAVLLVHPSYYGVVSDIYAITKICRSYGVPLLVDEAHGTHLRYHPDLPVDAMSVGADAAVQSVHKTGGAFTQASWLHLGNGLIDKDKVGAALRLLQTSSPSYLMLASLDAARRQLEDNGRKVFNKLILMVNKIAREINKLPGFKVLGNEHLGVPGAFGYDPTRLVISVGLGLSGHAVGQKLADEHAIYVEMTDAFNVIAVFSLGSRRSDADALVKGLADISRQPGLNKSINHGKLPFPAGPPLPPQILTPRRAWLASKKSTHLKDAIGKISAEIISVYPPGIASIYPGEEFTPDVVEYLMQVRDSGVHFQGAADPTLDSVKYVDI